LILGRKRKRGRIFEMLKNEEEEEEEETTEG